MSLLLIIFGLLLPSLAGVALVRAVEYRSPVLQPFERMVIGTIFGEILAMSMVFSGHALGLLRITLFGMSAGIAVTLLISLGLYYLFGRKSLETLTPLVQPGTLPRWFVILASIGAAWWAVKVLSAAVILLGTPAYIDDVYDNWNLRAKAYVTTGTILQEPLLVDPGIQSYPTTVPLLKSWLILLTNSWSEFAMNIPHLVWYISLPCILYFALRRRLNVKWSIIGCALFGTMTLPLAHASTAYADLLVSAVILACTSLLLTAIDSETAGQRASALRLTCLGLGLLIFTKNEGLVLYLPILLVATGMVCWQLDIQGQIERRGLARLIGFGVIALTTFLLPLLLWKWSNGLSFGNAKPISSMQLGWQPGVLSAIFYNTFREGNWGLVPALLVTLCVLRWRILLSWPVRLLGVILFGALALQWGAFLFTPLSVEAVMQTGLARGLIHIAPVAVLLTTFLLKAEQE